MLKYTSLLLLLACAACIAAQPAFPRYRDLQVYTTSAADGKNPAKIIASTTFVNRGTAPMKLCAALKAEKAVGFAGKKFNVTLAPGKSAAWTWAFTPPDGVQRVILTGSITINSRPERDLFVSVQGQDPADFNAAGVERITERARVVATFAPRTRRSILTEQQYLRARQPKSLLTLAAAGKTDYAIEVEVLPAPPDGKAAPACWTEMKLTESQREMASAVEDLQHCLQVQSGALLPVVAKADGPAIRLRVAKVEAKGLQDAYRLQTAGQDVIIESNDLEGLRQGVYGLLTDHLDCHWFQPRQLGEEIVIPKDRAVRLPALNEVQGSRWFSTMGLSWGTDRRWEERNRGYINRGRMNFGHAWGRYINKTEFPYEKFPDYYARDRQGKILVNDYTWALTNFCSTNPEVIDIVAKKINAYFAANPDEIVASLDPNDYAPMCLCDRCLALDKQYGVTTEDGTEVTDRVLHFSKEIYDRLEPQYKDRFLGILIYAHEIELPKGAKPHANHAGIVCDMYWTYDHSRPWNDPASSFNRHFNDLVKGWGGLVKQYGYYDYYGVGSFLGPWGMLHKMREDLPAFYDLGGNFLVLEALPNFATQGLNNYMAARLCWNVDADVDLLLEEFFTKYYGPAAEPMRNYWLASERFYNLERPGTTNPPRALFHPEFFTELDGDLAAARQAVANLPAEQKRFADRVRVASDGFDYARLTFNYDKQFGQFAGFSGAEKVDHAAAIQYLQAHRARLEELQTMYPQADLYWPPLIWNYFHLKIDEQIKEHQDALATK